VSVDLAKLPARTRTFLEHGAPEGLRQAEAFAAAVQLRDAGVVEADALALVETGAARCGLATSETHGAVKSAYRKPAREPITKERGGKGNGYKGPPLSRPASPPMSATPTATNAPATAETPSKRHVVNWPWPTL